MELSPLSRAQGRYPTRFTVQTGVSVETTDRFGRVVPSQPSTVVWSEPIAVVGWEKSQGQEKDDSEHELRLIDTLTVHWPAETAPTPHTLIRLPDSSGANDYWRVEGEPGDFTHGPWFNPGVVAVNCRRVTG